ncbi:hypothetical protein [Falsirhodobacter halotolerans]|uniref:hypothetical protein n=1 Tax=Falsirhodobacter halotolerans TaxID=1146892 RepID=UPI001FD3CA01|nr:hypothetical protein [Falsirhodobacter halotolerans]MCJ8141069.1 hypothetical protein [Falsirhodobacter halotolerans]
MTDLPERPHTRLLRASEAVAWTDGFAFLDAARTEAARLRATAAAEVAAARAEGRAEGRTEGAMEAARMVHDVRAALDRHLAGAEGQIIELVMTILRDTLAGIGDAEMIVRVTQAALRTLRGMHDLTLSVPVAHVAEVEERIAEMGATRIRVAPDRLLTGRQCVLTDADSSIDLGIDAQLAVLRAAMERAV